LRSYEPALKALDHAARLLKNRKRVTGVQQRIGKQTVATPLGHLSEKWKKHVVLGEEIAPNQYEAAAFEALNARLRSGDIAVGGSQRHQPFEDYLLPKHEFAQLVEKKQTRPGSPLRGMPNTTWNKNSRRSSPSSIAYAKALAWCRGACAWMIGENSSFLRSITSCRSRRNTTAGAWPPFFRVSLWPICFWKWITGPASYAI